MTSKLPPDLLNLFSPRPPLPYLKPLDRDIEKRKGPQISCISAYLDILKESQSSDHLSTETPIQKKDRLKKEREEKSKAKIKFDLENWKPHSNSNATEDPYKTLIISRLVTL
ncbi:U1 small nuclear ribonucleoprotein 70 kDa [Smittium mucronatum]|uniref:U1 small nuclear ribonucleoprotein 70 kDa n=1 Tax=Smittium mucronatum TaxID=133383 RepID=A0A1R0GVH9_9FUNG|nr:U1 small nuclear ribonucleoprotein 70 kDa [Smittium mucronatum]